MKNAEQNGKHYITIEVEPQSASISYNGKYYVRSGATTQELIGNALTEFLLSRYGKTWDDVPMPNVSVEDLENDAFKYFRKKAEESKRLSAKFLDCDNDKLLEKLSLVEGDYIKRAGALLFHAEPEKFSMGAYVKIGYFENGAKLVYHDEIRAPLIMQPDKVVDLLFTKYLKGIVSFKGIQRIETYPVAYDAVREAVLNAIAHRTYADSIPIQIKVFPDKIIIFGNGGFPSDWTEDDLLKSHKSRPYNPNIAQTFFRAGFIEAWGSGIERIKDACKAENAEFPEFEKSGNDLTVIFKMKQNKNYTANESSINGSINGSINSTIVTLMRENPAITVPEIANNLNLAKTNIESKIRILKKNGVISREGPRKSGHWVIK